MRLNNILTGAAAAALLVPASAYGQSAVDAYNLSKTELRGTARFMSMAGAFTALGGDLSTLNQNPAGIGIYRGSEVGFTLDINMIGTKSMDVPWTTTQNRTHADVNNVAYVGTFNVGDRIMQTFSWGISYGRQNSFERSFRGGGMPLQTSLSNYVANYTKGVNANDMNFDNGFKGYDPYQDSDINWLSILSYSAGIINPFYNRVENPGSEPEYELNGNFGGLFRYDNDGSGLPGSTGTANMEVRQRGYVDEYAIDFGGNLANTVYWGLGLGITDLDFEETTLYEESIQNGDMPNSNATDVVNADGTFSLQNWKKITGTGVNVKFGLILKPVNELRIGFAIHSPTWYSLTTSYQAELGFTDNAGFSTNQPEYTNTANYDWNLHTPWKMMFGLAGVIGGRGILSLDYEYQAYNSMKVSSSYDNFDDYNSDIKAYYKPVNTLRVGGEFRVTPQLSLRAGYSYSSTGVKNEVKNDELEVYTAGCQPGYETRNDTQNVTLGAGYRFGGFYVDFAYVHSHRTSEYHCFTPFTDYDGYWTPAPKMKLSDNNNRLVFSIGYKF